MNKIIVAKKPVIMFTIADEKNLPYAKSLENSLRKFHSEKEIPFKIITGDELKTELEKDPNFFYRATPVVAERLLKEYDLVIKIDADSIITGDLNYILKTKDYDVGTVMNWNKKDADQYGLVGIVGSPSSIQNPATWLINPAEYMNCGLVAMRNEKFVHHWSVVCFEEQFLRCQYREQDLLNLILYFGNYNFRCFDHGDSIGGMVSWWGLIGKSEYLKVVLKNDELIVPQAENNFPKRDTSIKVIHFAGGQGASKYNYKTMFTDEVSDRLDYLISVKKDEK